MLFSDNKTYRKRLAFYSLSESGQFASQMAQQYNGNKGYRLHWLFLGFSLAIAESVSRNLIRYTAVQSPLR